MLYPLSYEGLPCTFAQHAGLVSGRWTWVATSLSTACAAPVPRAMWSASDPPPRHAAPIVRLVVRGQEPEIGARRGTTPWA
jgi:hypothetical protein